MSTMAAKYVASVPENVMFASDLPHGVTDVPETVVDRLAPYLEPDAIEAVMGGNVESVYDR